MGRSLEKQHQKRDRHHGFVRIERRFPGAPAMFPDGPGMGRIFNRRIGEGSHKRDKDEDKGENAKPELDSFRKQKNNDINPNMAVKKIDKSHPKEEVSPIEVNRHFESPSGGSGKDFPENDFINDHKDQGQNEKTHPFSAKGIESIHRPDKFFHNLFLSKN
jgi:hypothetical protein